MGQRMRDPAVLLQIALGLAIAVGFSWGLPGSDSWMADSISPRSCGLGAIVETYLPGHYHKYPPLHMALLSVLSLPWMGLAASRVGAGVDALGAELIKPLYMTGIEVSARLVAAAMAIFALRFTMEHWGRLAGPRARLAAGAVLATMSFGWPLATSQSARLFLRLGFRDTALIGAGLCLIAVAGFLLFPAQAQVWQPILDTFVLGGGLGLLSVCTVVGPQSTVGWGQRGVVTGSVMFCRYLGQSLGAAVFGAIFNASLNARLRSAPGPLRARLPHSVSQVGATIGEISRLGPAENYLRDAISAGTHDVYLGLVVAAAVTIVIIATIIPRHVSTVASEDTPPAGLTPDRIQDLG
jgi:hypothetical protein